MKEDDAVKIDFDEHIADKKNPENEQFHIRIDKEQFVVDVPMMVGRKLLELAGKNPPEQYAVFQRIKGGQTIKIELDHTVDFRIPGVERFMTIPLDQTEG